MPCSGVDGVLNDTNVRVNAALNVMVSSLLPVNSGMIDVFL